MATSAAGCSDYCSCTDLARIIIFIISNVVTLTATIISIIITIAATIII